LVVANRDFLSSGYVLFPIVPALSGDPRLCEVMLILRSLESGFNRLENDVFCRKAKATQDSALIALDPKGEKTR